MSEAIGLGGTGAITRDLTLTLFGQTMAYVAATVGFFALGAYLGRNLSESLGWVLFIAAIACLFAMTDGPALGPAHVAPPRRLRPSHWRRHGTPPHVLRGDRSGRLWQAGGATALFIAGFGAAGYAIRRDLTALARIAFFALLALIIFGIVLIFVQIPQGTLIYAVLGLVIFAALTMFDFQRLRRSKDIASAPLMAASIFLDILNVFLFFLRIFGSNN